MILNLTPLEDAWGVEPVSKNIYKSNEPQRKFLSSGFEFEEKQSFNSQQYHHSPTQFQNQQQYPKQIQNQQYPKQIQNQQYGHSPKQSLTKNDIYQPGLFHQRRVDVALYNDIIIDKLGHLTSDEKTHYVTNALLEYHKPQQNHNRTKHIEYFNNPQCNEYHDFNVKPNNNNIDVLWIVTLFLILLLIDKVYNLAKFLIDAKYHLQCVFNFFVGLYFDGIVDIGFRFGCRF